MRPAIVISAFDRDKSLERLLGSLSRAHYPEDLSVPLIISIDKSSNNKVVEVARNFIWAFGPKKVLEHKKNLGLRKHILLCGDLAYEYGSIILLEDDLYVSPYFYDYSLRSLSYFRDDSRIAGVSLFNHIYNETAKKSFCPRDDGYDNYFIQLPSSWGQAWTVEQWSNFKNWYEVHSRDKIVIEDRVPLDVTEWPESSWKKYFIKYMVDENLYFSFPRTSLTTNFMDPGTHHKEKLFTLQTELQEAKKNYKFSSQDTSKSVYDCFCEISPEIIKMLNPVLSEYDFEVDLNGVKDPAVFLKEYFLTSKVSHEPVMAWDMGLKPHEQNIINNLRGGVFKLVRRANCLNKEELKLANLLNYYYSVPINQINWQNQVSQVGSQISGKEALHILIDKTISKLRTVFLLKKPVPRRQI